MLTTEQKILFIKEVFGPAHLMSDGINVHVMCPSCGKSPKKKKFVIRLDNDLCHCFVCGLKGRTLAPIIRKFGSRENLAFYNENFLGASSTIEDSEEQFLKISLPPDFTFLANYQDAKDPDVRDALKYLKSRGMTERDFWYFKFGICFEGAYRRRVVMPSFDAKGNLNFYTGRSIDDTHYMKYQNSKVNKTDIIFNELNIDWHRELTLVEGPFDLVKCDDNSTCLLGSTLSKDSYLFQKIAENKTPVVIGLDSDAEEKTIKIAKALYDYNVEVKILDLGSKNDVGEMSKKEFLKAKKSATPWSTKGSLLSKISTLKSGLIF